MNETCDICKTDFPSSEPNEAVADAKIKGIGCWGYLCLAHLGYGVRGHITMLETVEA
jgi:hypothetical protein